MSNPEPGRVLMIDDDLDLVEVFCYAIEKMGHEASRAPTLGEGVELAERESFDLVLLDVCLPDGNGLEALPRLRATEPTPEIVILTGHGDPDGAELAINSGAWDYIVKPASTRTLRLVVSRAVHYQREKRARRRAISLKRQGIVGDSPALSSCLDQLAAAAGSDADVLLTGETGTGKEMFAAALHANSDRAGGPFVVVDCPALPRTLIESTLFGHEKGAYTGAAKPREGLVARADGGTLFLDEVGELPPAEQKTFLRVLQERRYRPVGSRSEQSSDFRLVAATNRELERMVRQGEFREDLMFRLRAFVIELPPLRERPGDIKPLALHHVSRLCERYGVDTKGFSPDFFETLRNYDWPGNVRELFQALEQALATAGPEPTLFARDLPLQIRARVARESIPPPPAASGSAADSDDSSPASTAQTLQEARDEAIARAERRHLVELLRRTDGSIPDTCRLADLSRSRLYALLKKHGIRS
jgi:two-component system, NtrC family, response regulator